MPIRNFFLVVTLAAAGSTSARAEGLIRSLWGCSVPCTTKGTDSPAGYLTIAYCSTTTLSVAMIEKLTPLCQEKLKRTDVVAARASATEVAACSSSGNPCPKEGLSRASFQCSYLCPSEDKVIRRFTACASTGDEAWSYAREICRDATPPHRAYAAPAHVCHAEGQTPCE